MRILLVEDEEKVSRVIAKGLVSESFAVDTAGDGKEGLELALAYDYDLIILDLMLPGLNGTEVLRAVRIETRSLTRLYTLKQGPTTT